MSDLLFDVPKNRTKLDLFKERNGVWIHKMDPEIRHPEPWFAMLFEHAKRHISYALTDDEEKSPVALIAGYGNLIQNAGWCADGTTEEDACFKLAQQNKLAWP